MKPLNAYELKCLVIREDEILVRKYVYEIFPNDKALPKLV